MIVALAGKKGAGKTTGAQVFLKRGFKQISFAAPLKSIASAVLELSLEILNDPILKENYQISIQVNNELIDRLFAEAAKYLPIPKEAYEKAYALEKPLFTNPRLALQWIGTDLFRNCVNQNFWLMLFEAQIDPKVNYVCDDCRFPNESDMINKLKGKVILVNRPGLKSTDNHASEQTHLLKTDYMISNYDLTDFRNDIGMILDLMTRSYSEPKVER